MGERLYVREAVKKVREELKHIPNEMKTYLENVSLLFCSEDSRAVGENCLKQILLVANEYKKQLYLMDNGLALKIIQVLVYRFDTLHLPQLIRSWKFETDFIGEYKVESRVRRKQQVSGYRFNVSESSDNWIKIFVGEIEDWEIRFWKFYSKNSLNQLENKELNNALRDSKSIEAIESVKRNYEIYDKQLRQINVLSETMNQEVKNRKIYMVRDLRKLLDLLERNIEGSVGYGDIIDMEEKINLWKEEIYCIHEILEKNRSNDKL